MNRLASILHRPVLAVWLMTAVPGVTVAVAGHDRFLHSVRGGLSDEYDDIATSLVREGRYSAVPDGPPTVIRGPAYPVYLAGLYRVAGVGNTLAVAIGDLLLHATTAALLASVLLRFAGPVAALVGGLAHAFWPTTFYYAAKGSSETMLNLWLVATVAAAIALRNDPRPRHAAALGAAFALACLTRGSAVTVGAVAFAALATGFRPAAAARLLGIAALVWAAVMSPWWIRNAAVTGTFVPFHTLVWYNAYHDDVFDQRKAWLARNHRDRAELGSVPVETYPPTVLRHPDGYVYPAALSAREDLAQEARYRTFAMALYREPGYLAAKVRRNLVDFWSASSTVRKDRVLLASSVAWLGLYVAGFVTAWRRRRHRGALAAGLAVVLLSWAIYLPFLAIFRHSIPVAPFIAGTLGIAAGGAGRNRNA